MSRNGLYGIPTTILTLFWSLALPACEQPLVPGDVPPVEAVVSTREAALVVSSSYIDIRSRTGTGVSLGRTCGSSNEVTPACVGSSAPEFSHHWVAPYDGAFTFSTQGPGTTFDTVLEITRWADSASLGCNDNAGGAVRSTVTVNLAANQEVRIAVDGRGVACGNFQLDIQGVPSTCGACNTPPSPCHEPNGTCYSASCVYPLKQVGAACDDSNACTLGDTCSGSGVCQGAPITCNSPPGQCYATAGTCTNGTCQYAPRQYGTSCSDGDSCTQGDYCGGNGACYSGDRTCCPNGDMVCNGYCCGSNAYCDGSACRLCSTNDPYLTLRYPTCSASATAPEETSR
jgi:hypothetical protein